MPSLRALLESAYEVSAVVTRPDRPAGRGRKLRPSAVKEAAAAGGIPLLQPAKLRAPETVAALAELEAAFYVVAAYGALIPPAVLDLPPSGVLNVHPSLLPRYRGASPIPGAILAGEVKTGVTIMLMDEGLDTGPILAQRSTTIGANESAGELSDRLSQVAADLLLETLPPWLDGSLKPRTQDDSQATNVGQLSKETAEIGWDQDAEEIWRKVRAYNPWPGAATTLAAGRLQLWEAWPVEDNSSEPPGTVLSLSPVETPSGSLPALVVRCARGALAILRLQKEGRRPLAADEFARGERNLVGGVLGGGKQ